jgi:hypothetical protein
MTGNEIKFAIIEIPTDPETDEFKRGVQIYFKDKDGNRVEGQDDPFERQPILVKPEYLTGEKLYVDYAMWHISNPTCVTWNGRRK